MTYVHLGQAGARPVRVRLDDGTTCEGQLEAYRDEDGRWLGYVRYSSRRDGFTSTRLAWFPEDRIRPG